YSFFSSYPDTPGSRWGGEKREKYLALFEMASFRPDKSPTDRRPPEHSHSHRERWTMSSRLRAGGRSLWALALAVILGSSATALAQTPTAGTGTITGKVTDKGGKDPVSYAT